MSDETEVKLRRIERLNDKTIVYALGKNRINKAGCFELNPEEAWRYAKALAELNRTIKSLCGKTVPAVNYISTTLALCADQETTAPAGERRGHWFDVCQALQEIFNEYDHDEAEIDLGVERAAKIKQVMSW